MRIAHVMRYSQPQLGYQEYFLPKSQLESGHDVKIFTGDRYYNLPNYETVFKPILGERIVGTGEGEEMGVPTLRLPICIEMSPQIILRGLRRALLDYDPDVVICHCVLSFNAFAVSGIPFERPVKIIYDEHTLVPGRLRFRMKAFVYRHFLRPRVSRSAHAIFCISRPICDLLVDQFGFPRERMHYIPLGYNPEHYAYSDQRRQSVREKLGVRDGDLVALYTGKILRSKGIEELLEAIPVLLGKYPNLHFLFAGGGEQYLVDRIKSCAGGQVRFLGYQDAAGLGDLFCGADFGLWPQHITISQIEATGCHLPIIVSDHPDCEERVEAGNGQRLRECSAQEICAAVSRYVEDPSLLSQHRIRASELAEKLSWDQIGKAVMALVETEDA
jgi:glycosyltransferase involved in cell wall biosynthesis